MTIRRDERGQATVEYILMLAVLTSVFIGVMKALGGSGLSSKLTQPITGAYKRAYQNGHPEATSVDDGGKRHPRMLGKAESFRIFINPERK